MKIETKLKIGDESYFVENDGIRKGEVVKISTSVESDRLGDEDISIDYIIVRRGKAHILNEVAVFASLEEALKALERKFRIEEEDAKL